MSDEELYQEAQLACRELEAAELDQPAFKLQARELWWAFCEESTGKIKTFREFWNNESTYPRTIT